jgi:hypothetical protein
VRISAEGALKTVFRSYLQELCTLAEIERRVDAMEAKALQQCRDAGLPDMFSKDKQWARRLRATASSITARISSESGATSFSSINSLRMTSGSSESVSRRWNTFAHSRRIPTICGEPRSGSCETRTL